MVSGTQVADTTLDGASVWYLSEVEGAVVSGQVFGGSTWPTSFGHVVVVGSQDVQILDDVFGHVPVGSDPTFGAAGGRGVDVTGLHGFEPATARHYDDESRRGEGAIEDT